MSTNEIAALERREKELEKQLHAVQALLHAAKVAASGIKIGDIVLYKKVEHRVTHIDPGYGDLKKPWLRGNPKKKDGTFGTADRALYSHWEKP